MNNNQRKVNTFVLLLVVIFSVILLGATVLVYTNYLTEIRSQASTKADLYTADGLRLLEAEIADGISLAKQVANKLNGLSSRDDVAATLRGLRSDSTFDGVAFCRFFADGTIYGQFGTVYPLERENVMKLAGTNVARCCGLVADREWNTNTIGFYAPVLSGFADGVVLFFPGDTFSTFVSDVNAESAELARVAVFADSEGETLAIFHKDEDVNLSVHNNIYDYLTAQINEKATIDSLKNDLVYERSASYEATVYSEDYVVSIGTPKSGGGLSIIALYSVERLCRSSFQLINAILGILIMVFAILIFMGSFVLITRKVAERKRLEASLTDPVLNCPTRVKFERDAQPILEKNKNSKFAVVLSEIKHFQYIQEYFGQPAAEESLKYVAMVFGKMMQVDELYAYAGDGRFLLLLHFRERENVTKRLQTVSGLAYNHKGLLPERYHLELSGGVYETTEGNYSTIAKMIDNAFEARTSANVIEVGDYKFFTENIRSSNLQNADIEIRQESALDNGEFVVVYQPKYNMHQDKPDG
ncbi:MAG: GGDEF domain-containing protein, partial [Clostridia bacterium]|nr:GGDEF domain-containing protein [Clostridia bacterium]